MNPLSGYATEEGTNRFRQRFAGALANDHFRRVGGLWISSIGLGTYLGDPNDATDQQYAQSMALAVQHGCNVIDSAINYRCQRGERVIGHVLQQLVQDNICQRDEIVVATKGGFIPFDGEHPAQPETYVHQTFVETGTTSLDDVVGGCHCIAPNYLAHQLAASRHNLQLETIDIYYLHNPETQLQEVEPSEFEQRLLAAWGTLESAVRAGHLRRYGTATWDGFRTTVDSHGFLSLHRMLDLATEASASGHHFGAVQLPYNLVMPEAVSSRNQQLDGRPLSTTELAGDAGLLVCASASLLQGRLTGELPDSLAQVFPDLKTSAQRALQFVRSSPGIDVALVGMKHVDHVEENLSLARVGRASIDQLVKLFEKSAPHAEGESEGRVRN